MLTYVWRLQDIYTILGSIKLPILAAAGMLGMYFMDQDPRRAFATVSHRITKTCTAIVVLAVASVPTSVYQGLSFGFIKDDFSKTFLLMLILIASIREFEDLRRYAGALVIGGFIYAQYIYLNVPVGMNGRLGNLVYYDANDLGMLLVCSIPLALYFLLRGRHFAVKVLSAVAIALFILVIVKTGSRGAFLGLIAVGVYLLIGFTSVRKPMRIAAVAGAFAVLMLVGNETYWTMMGTLLNPKEDYNWSGQSETGRMDVWKRGMGYMISRPITGVGVRAFPVAEGTITERAALQEYGIGFKWSAAHNSFVEIGAELGVFGLVFLILLLTWAYTTARTAFAPARASPRSVTVAASDELMLGQALAGSIVGYTVCGFFLSQAYAVYMFTIYGLIVGLAKVAAMVNAVPAGAERSASRGRATLGARPAARVTYATHS